MAGGRGAPRSAPNVLYSFVAQPLVVAPARDAVLQSNRLQQHQVATIADAFKAEALRQKTRPVVLSWVATPVNYTTMDLAVLNKLRSVKDRFVLQNKQIKTKSGCGSFSWFRLLVYTY